LPLPARSRPGRKKPIVVATDSSLVRCPATTREDDHGRLDRCSTRALRVAHVGRHPPVVGRLGKLDVGTSTATSIALTTRSYPVAGGIYFRVLDDSIP